MGLKNSGSKAGFNILGVIFSVGVASVVVLGTLSAVTRSVQLDALTRERNVALRAAKVEIEDILSMKRTEFVTAFDPAVIGPVKFFSVPGLEPQEDQQGTPLPQGLIFVRKAPNKLFIEAEFFTVYVEVRWKSGISRDQKLGFNIVVNPLPDNEP